MSELLKSDVWLDQISYVSVCTNAKKLVDGGAPQWPVECGPKLVGLQYPSGTQSSSSCGPGRTPVCQIRAVVIVKGALTGIGANIKRESAYCKGALNRIITAGHMIMLVSKDRW